MLLKRQRQLRGNTVSGCTAPGGQSAQAHAGNQAGDGDALVSSDASTVISCSVTGRMPARDSSFLMLVITVPASGQLHA